MRRTRVLWCALIGTGLLALAVNLASGQVRRQGRVGPDAGQPPEPPPPPTHEPPPPPPGQEPPALPDIPADATPEEIVAFCIETATRIADRHVAENTEAAEAGVATIELLLDAGQTDNAHAVARWCIRWIDTQTHRGVEGIHHLCRHCARALIRAGGDREMAEQMHAACREQVERILTSRREAVDAVKTAIGEPEEPAPEA